MGQLTNWHADLWLLGRTLIMPELHATFYAAIVLVWYLDRVARNSRPKRRAFYCISPIPG